ncbi:MAG TPA: type II secretion system protein [Planctomycetota bacterium]|nr:type II secretion system protein [Planctomycetota bacterium]
MHRTRSGFTLIELLVVISVLAVLAVILVTAVTGSLARARKTAAMSNIRGCRVMIQQYMTKTGDIYGFPKRLTYCATRYGFMEEPGIFLDPADAGHGKFGPFPGGWPGDRDWYNKDLGEGMAGSPSDELPCSFIYEMADIPASKQGTMLSWMYNSPPSEIWDRNRDGLVSWKEYKIYQLNAGDSYSNSYGVSKYPAALFPVLRSGWWATYDYNVDFDNADPSNPTSQNSIASVLCESMDGGYFETTIFWEAYVLKRMGKPVPASDFQGK